VALKMADLVDALTLSKFADEVRAQYCRNDVADRNTRELTYKLEGLREEMRAKAAIRDVNKVAADLKGLVDHNFEKSSLKRDCAKDQLELQKQVDKQRSDIEKLRKAVKKLELKAEEASATLGTKVNAQELEDVRDRLAVLPTSSEV